MHLSEASYLSGYTETAVSSPENINAPISSHQNESAPFSSRYCSHSDLNSRRFIPGLTMPLAYSIAIRHRSCISKYFSDNSAATECSLLSPSQGFRPAVFPITGQACHSSVSAHSIIRFAYILIASRYWSTVTNSLTAWHCSNDPGPY